MVFPLVSQKIDVDQIFQIADNFVGQTEKGSLDPLLMTSDILSIDQVDSVIVTLVIPGIFYLFAFFASFCFCCGMCCNASKPYFKARTKHIKSLVDMMERYNIQVDRKRDVIEQVKENSQLMMDPQVIELFRQIEDLDNSAKFDKTFRCMCLQKSYYICYWICLCLSLICYIGIICYVALYTNLHYGKQAANDFLAAPNEIQQRLQPAAIQLDDFVNKYYMNQDEFNVLQKTLKAEYTPDQFADVVQQIYNKVDNLETFDDILTNVNNLFSEDQDQTKTLVYAIRQLPFYRKCNEDYILSNQNNQEGCSQTEQTQAYISGWKLLNLLYDLQTKTQDMSNSCDNIITVMEELPPNMQDPDYIQEIQNQKDSIPDIAEFDLNGIQVQLLLDIHDDKKDAHDLVNEILETQFVDYPEINDLMNSDQPQPSIQDLTGYDVSNTSALIDQFVELNLEPIPDDTIDLIKKIYEGYQIFANATLESLYNDIYLKDNCIEGQEDSLKCFITDSVQQVKELEEELMTNPLFGVIMNGYLILVILLLLIAICPTFCCMTCEGFKYNCCYGCIQCCMPAQLLVTLVFYACFFAFGFSNTGLLNPSIKTLTIKLQDTTDQSLQSLFKYPYIKHDLVKQFSDDLDEYQRININISTETPYIKLLNQNDTTLQQFVLDINNLSLQNVINTFNFKVDAQQENEIDPTIQEPFNEFPASIAPHLFTKLTSVDRILNETLNKVSENMIINVDLQGSKIQIFSDKQKSVFDDIRLGGQNIFQTFQTVISQLLQNTLVNSNILVDLLQANSEQDAQLDQLTDDILNQLGINSTVITDIVNNISDSFDVCAVSDALYDGLQVISKLSYPQNSVDADVISIPTVLYQYVQQIEAAGTPADKKNINITIPTLPTNIDDFELTQLESVFYNFIMFNEFTDGTTYINGQNVQASLSFEDFLKNMYQNGESQFTTLINDYLTVGNQNIIDDWIASVISEDYQQYSNSFGCPRYDMLDLEDAELVQYITNYTGEINTLGQDSYKFQNIANIIKAISDQQDPTTITEDDVFYMYGYCYSVQQLNQMLLEEAYFDSTNTDFYTNVQYVANLYPQAQEIRQEVQQINGTLIDTYQELFGDSKQCTTTGNEFTIDPNPDSFQYTGYDQLKDVFYGSLNGVRQGLLDSNIIKPSLIKTIQDSQILDQLSNMLNETLNILVDVVCGDNAIITQTMMQYPFTLVKQITNQLVGPFEGLGVFVFILMVIAFLLPCLLCCSKKYSYQRYQEKHLDDYIKKVQKEFSNNPRNVIVQQQQFIPAVQLQPAVMQINPVPIVLQQPTQINNIQPVIGVGPNIGKQQFQGPPPPPPFNPQFPPPPQQFQGQQLPFQPPQQQLQPMQQSQSKPNQSPKSQQKSQSLSHSVSKTSVNQQSQQQDKQFQDMQVLQVTKPSIE